MKTTSEYLAELRKNGITVIEGLVPPDAITRIRAETQEKLDGMNPPLAATDDRLGLANAIAWSADVCEAVANETALSVIRAYMGTENIHFGHNPVMTVLRPAKDLIGTFPPSGWHSDYPYHQDVFPESRWWDEAVYGVQFNICIDEFRSENGGTQFVPGSHLKRCFVPEAFNEHGTRMGEAPFEDVQQMHAPAGSALIYDARIWHRACPELNVSGADRLAILNAVNPSWVRLMADREAGREEFIARGMAANLSPRVNREITALCHSAPTTAPPGAPLLREKIRSPKRFKL